MARVLMLLPSRDFDPTESAGAWKVLTEAGHEVEFATPDGKAGEADELMLTGRGLDPWGFVPGLRRVTVIGRILAANGDGRRAYGEMEKSAEFRTPKRWEDAGAGDYDGLVLPGGHRARGMRPYLESAEPRRIVLEFFRAGKPVAAICHGVLLAARTLDPETGRSVLYGKKTTALTWAFERKGAMTGRIARFWDRRYYRTYWEEAGQPPGYMSVQQEVKRALAKAGDFVDVDPGSGNYRRQTSGMHRDSPGDAGPAFVVRDGNYVSARWPGDVFTFARTFAEVLSAAEGRRGATA